jgi:hypothetical protein
LCHCCVTVVLCCVVSLPRVVFCFVSLLCHCCLVLCCVSAACCVLLCVTVVSLLLNPPLPLAASCVTASVSNVVAAHSVD